MFSEIPSTVDVCKRALVILIRALAVAYGFRVIVSRYSTDQVIKRAYHTTSKRTHPDKGGSTQDQTAQSELGTANSAGSQVRKRSCNLLARPPAPRKSATSSGEVCWVLWPHCRSNSSYGIYQIEQNRKIEQSFAEPAQIQNPPPHTPLES